MAPVFTTVKELVEENSPDDFLEASKILIKFADNILKNPNELKYRKIRLGNPVIESKLLPVVGALSCLFEMGFEEDGEYLTFPTTSPLTMIQQIRTQLDAEVQKLTQQNGPKQSSGNGQQRAAQPVAVEDSMNAQQTTTQNPGTVQRQAAPNPLMNVPRQQIFQMEKDFFHKIEGNLRHVLIYEDPTLQHKARAVIPVETLKKRAHEKLETIKKEDKSALSHIDFRDLMLLELLAWFKNSFFKWVDAPSCESCGGTTRMIGMVEPTPDEIHWNAGRVENYKCDRCQRFIRFPRFSHPEKLLQTRCGRCGEWANCFTLCCRAVGFEARYVLDWTDHVWTEVYSEVQKRWLHCDPCENICDKPLIYEAGWGKKLSYVLAFSVDGIQDVTWRYSVKHNEVLSRRNECRESWLVQIIHKLWKAKEGSNSQRNDDRKMKLLVELVEFMSPNTDDGQTYSGRTSGSLAWRLARGETTQKVSTNEEYVFKLTESEKQNKIFHVKYSCAKDEYVRLSSANELKKQFSSCVEKVKNLFRKEERDWKMVYLARTEGSATAAVAWKFDFTGMEVDKIDICASSQTYENGVVSWRLCSNNQCAVLSGGSELKTIHDLKGASEMTLTAMLSGGKGSTAWQHTQLFRQKLDDMDLYPLDIKVYFK